MRSFIWVIVLTVGAAIVSLVPDLSTDVRVYIACGLIFAGIGAIAALHRERKQDKAEQIGRDRERDRIAAEGNAVVAAKLEAMDAKVEKLVEVTGISRHQPAYQEVRAAANEVRVSMAAMAPAKVIQSGWPRSTVADSRAGVLPDQSGKPVDGK